MFRLAVGVRIFCHRGITKWGPAYMHDASSLPDNVKPHAMYVPSSAKIVAVRNIMLFFVDAVSSGKQTTTITPYCFCFPHRTNIHAKRWSSQILAHHRSRIRALASTIARRVEFHCGASPIWQSVKRSGACKYKKDMSTCRRGRRRENHFTSWSNLSGATKIV